jgi:hypothetical protein
LTAVSQEKETVIKPATPGFTISADDDYYLFKNTTLEVINENSDRTMDNYQEFSLAKKMRMRSSSRLKLNTSQGIQNYAYVSLPKSDQMAINEFEITTYKPDGRVLTFDSTQLLHSSVNDLENNTNLFDITKYVIPGVEVGDEIEVTYSMEFTGNFTSRLFGNIFQYDIIPSLHSEYKIIIPYPYKIFYKCYNDYKQPVTTYDGLKATTTFSVDSLIEINNTPYACLSNVLPYFYYSIEFNSDTTQFITWKDFYNDYIGFLYPSAAFTSFDYQVAKQWISKSLKPYKEKTNIEKFMLLYAKLQNDFELFDPYDGTTTTTTVENFHNNKIDRNSLFRLYATLLDYLNIDFYFCFGRNKYQGLIDNNFLRKDEITEFFLMFKTPGNQTNFIYPHELGQKYCFDELPTYLNGTDVYIIKNKELSKKKEEQSHYFVPNDSLLDIQQLRVDNIAYRDNYYHRTRMIGVDLQNNEANYFSMINYSGCSSTDNRHFFNALFKDKELYDNYIKEVQNNRDLFKIDTIYLRSERLEYPYKYSVGMKGKLGKFYNFINDSTILISTSEMMKNNTIDYDRQNRNMDIMLTYPFSDIQEVIIDFNRPISVINIALLNKEYSNSLGSFRYEATIIGENKLRITSTYIINTENIPCEEFKNLNALNDVSDEMSTTRIIIGIKK